MLTQHGREGLYFYNMHLNLTSKTRYDCRCVHSVQKHPFEHLQLCRLLDLYATYQNGAN
jgi:hypothetical protein